MTERAATGARWHRRRRARARRLTTSRRTGLDRPRLHRKSRYVADRGADPPIRLSVGDVAHRLEPRIVARTELRETLRASYALVLRPRLLHWGATDEEVGQPYPGADLIAAGRRGAKMAVTIDAPPSRVWPWLVEMGCDRGGWYSWDRLDNGGVASAQEIRPEWQHIAVGDRLASSPSGRAWFEVAAVEPDRFLALRAPLDLRGHPFDTAGQRPRFYFDSLWAFLLEEQPGGRTRLVVSGYSSSNPRLLTAIGDFLFWEPAHWIMQNRQFANLKRRTERPSDTAADRPTEPARVGAAGA